MLAGRYLVLRSRLVLEATNQKIGLRCQKISDSLYLIRFSPVLLLSFSQGPIPLQLLVILLEPLLLSGGDRARDGVKDVAGKVVEGPRDVQEGLAWGPVGRELEVVEADQAAAGTIFGSLDVKIQKISKRLMLRRVSLQCNNYKRQFLSYINV